MRRWATTIGMALALAACAPTTTQAQGNDVSANSSLPAPTPSDVRVRITQEQNGQVIQVGLNQRFAVELVGVPTAGYVWTPAVMPDFLTRAGEASGGTTRAQSQPGFAGGNHWEVLMFAATRAGRGELVLEQRRPWETDQAPTQVFRVEIEAR
ncbi:MAG TPA: protease inhibitor I42 family protein [Caulobacterales bacterium]|nr:protease inhibitor I42 family protein [Caulobacterales bacterium]